jgi:hypothetical protein
MLYDTALENGSGGRRASGRHTTGRWKLNTVLRKVIYIRTEITEKILTNSFEN